ncbi:hypothetical protein K470DRAFT_268365 [Piedraia hortae CBS 480.64]|uniref:Cyclin N-terminal domain-containing protein n=1 Tax=Piedraia hortae CBS 480.64 TaxID=1314780 RepID=A0A6A7C6V4_9PEZI|nr:hypothetical protein K470DRAFT_268365 [Piedraia hortae CBS 480.64]
MTIAPSLQIPRSVNDSGGSLADLAAQVTCLFWFETTDLISAIETSARPLLPPRLLSLGARPSTGFRKWVATTLAATLVSPNVVLLALLFIYRLKKLNPSVRGKLGSEFRLLTVALMLANKFLDDSTYTNKTWADVSGILVGEIHVMEVEFLSNMQYNLYTSAEEWAAWQSRLATFSLFVDSTAHLPPSRPPAILPPASSLAPSALPSPPVSNQASPPAAAAAETWMYGQMACDPTPAPSPLDYHHHSRKRSLEDAAEPPAKRVPRTRPTRLPPNHVTAPQLPPSRALGIPYTVYGVSSRPQSPAPSPADVLRRRSSPYRPVQHVSTLLHPPPSGLMHAPPLVPPTRIRCQPLSKPTRPPYVDLQCHTWGPLTSL